MTLSVCLGHNCSVEEKSEFKRGEDVSEEVEKFCFVKFESIFQHIVIVQSFDTVSPQRQMLKNPCMKFLLRYAICAI